MSAQVVEQKVIVALQKSMEVSKVVQVNFVDRLRTRTLLIAFLALPFVGCGGDISKVVVTGKVTYDGKLVTNGDIRFFPTFGSEGSVSGAPIVDGVYEALYKGGVPVGTHRVEIRAFVLEGVGPATGPAANSADLLTKASRGSGSAKLALPVYVVEGREQFLPPKYNSQSELEIKITGDEARQAHDFVLTAKKP